MRDLLTFYRSTARTPHRQGSAYEAMEQSMIRPRPRIQELLDADTYVPFRNAPSTPFLTIEDIFSISTRNGQPVGSSAYHPRQRSRLHRGIKETKDSVCTGAEMFTAARRRPSWHNIGALLRGAEKEVVRGQVLAALLDHPARK